MVKGLAQFPVFALAFFGFVVDGPLGVSLSGESKDLTVATIEDLGARDLPVVDSVSRDVWVRLGSAEFRAVEDASPKYGVGGFAKTAPANAEGVRFTVVSTKPLQAVKDLRLLLGALSFVPFVPDTDNTIFVDRFGDLAFFSGTAIPPIAVRLNGIDDGVERMKIAKGSDGKGFFPGGVAGTIEKVQVGGRTLFILRRDPEGLGMLEQHRSLPRKELLVAWDENLQQLPSLPFDEIGVNNGRLWVQRNVDAFQVPASIEGPWFATSWHCPHFVYQYSLLNPVSREPSVLTMRLFFETDGHRFYPAEVLIDMVDAAEFRGSSAACQRFKTKDEILSSRFGRYRGEGRTDPAESGSGEEYLNESMSFSLAYLGVLKDALGGRQTEEVTLTSTVAQAFEALGQANECSLTGEERVVEIGGISPTVYLDAMR